MATSLAIASDGNKRTAKLDDVPWRLLPHRLQARLEALGWCCSLALLEVVYADAWGLCRDINTPDATDAEVLADHDALQDWRGDYEGAIKIIRQKRHRCTGWRAGTSACLRLVRPLLLRLPGSKESPLSPA